MKLQYEGAVDQSGFGWGTCNQALSAALAALIPDDPPTGGVRTASGPTRWQEPDVVFMPLADHDFNPATAARGKVNLAYTFFEFALGPNAAANAARYETVFAGSTWCLERMRERGITNGKLLMQGVDGEIFKPRPPRVPSGTFRIFSGGKFEYRKGQDLVIAAFAEFARKVPGAHLVCSWFNPWPQLIQNMSATKCIRWPIQLATARSQQEAYSWFLQENELRPDQFTVLPQLNQRELAREMANTDCGLFPNRCEGGTNLVLMEYASLGRTTVANIGTGHRDIADAITVQIPACEDESKWTLQTVPDIVESLMWAHRLRAKGFEPIPKTWKWEDAARIVLQTGGAALRGSA